MVISFEELAEDSIILWRTHYTQSFTKTTSTKSKLSVISNYALQLLIIEYTETH